tara:strand:- start:10076 stop:11416 length:1341 start_codon:yes stop_codon:yes gene_type:complete
MIAVNNYEDFGNQSNGYANDFGFYGGGGGFGGGGSTTTTTSNQIVTTPANRVFQITSNIVGAQIYINGINTYKTTSENITFTKEELLSTDKTITIVKEGYTNGEKYVISVENPNGATIIKPSFLRTGGITETLGLSSTVIRVKYYINDVEQVSNDSATFSSTIQNLSFNLTQSQIITNPTLYNFNVNISGAGNSVRVVKNGSVEFFPDNGSTPYSDLGGTTFRVESANTSLYRITQIQFNSIEPIVAAANESLTYNVILNKNITISIITELVRVSNPALNPIITLLKSEAITYNINSKLGVPIGFLKNADVKAVTVIVGSDVLEFDDLQQGDVAGITIPHSVFKNIGKYGAKIYPFSLSDYENEVRPVETPIKITPKPLPGIDTPSKEILTEVVKPIIPKVIVNPYVGGATPSIGTTKPIVVQSTPKVKTPHRGGGGRSRNTENIR